VIAGSELDAAQVVANEINKSGHCHRRGYGRDERRAGQRAAVAAVVRLTAWRLSATLGEAAQ
jgi:dsRNA-specific ribonuclease